MKKRILLLITLFIFGIGVSFGQCINEDFTNFSDWTNSGTANDTTENHAGTSTPCRAVKENSSITSPSVDNPNLLEFHQDSSGGGNGNTATVAYKINTGSWITFHSFAVSTNGVDESVDLTNLSGVNLSNETNVSFQFNSTFNTWYLDDVVVTCIPSGSQTPTVSFDTTTSAIIEGDTGTTTHNVAVTMNVAPTANASVDVYSGGNTATDGVDYDDILETIIFLTTYTYPKTINVPITIYGDTDIESDETIDVVLEMATGSESLATLGTDAHTITITDDDVAPVVLCSQLIISEYGEPSSGNGKYIEIYNTSSSDIDLTNYELWKISNGGSWTENSPYSLVGIIKPYTTYVVGNNSEDVPTADVNNATIAGFNGNDAIGLAYNGGSGSSFTLIDAIGTDGSDPDSGWSVAGVSNGTKDHTLIRKFNVQKPNTNWTLSAGTNASDSEWIVVTYGQNNLNMHSSMCQCSDEAIYENGAWVTSPTATSLVVIKDNYDTTVSFSSCACQVETTKTLTVKANSHIKVDGNIINNGTIIIENTGSLVQVNDNATVTGSGIFSTEVKTTSMPDARYTYFSSPSQTETMAVFSSWDEASRNFTFDGSTQNWAAVAPGDTMTPGKGYIVRPEIGASYPAQFTTYFTGAFNNGVITHPLTFNSGGTDDDNELVGNPYPSAIGTAALLAANTDANAFYFWSHSAGGDWSAETYLTWNTSGTSNGAPATIASGQGFFVTATANGTLTFNNALRQTGNNTTFLRPTTSNLDKLWLSIEANAEVGAKILIAFNPICSDGFDAQYDAISFNGTNKLDFYSFGTGLNTNNLVIQTRGELNNNDTVIPLGFSFNSTDATITNLTISIDHFENLTNENIYLRDNLLNTLHNLKVSEYNFTLSEAGINDTRFELVFSRGALSVNDNLISSDDLFISSIDATNFKVVMRNNLVITNFKAFDILGKLIIDINPNQSSFNVNTDIKEGTILVTKSTLENGQVVSKKFIKL